MKARVARILAYVLALPAIGYSGTVAVQAFAECCTESGECVHGGDQVVCCQAPTGTAPCSSENPGYCRDPFEGQWCS